jgi:hypothetical protein
MPQLLQGEGSKNFRTSQGEIAPMMRRITSGTVAPTAAMRRIQVFTDEATEVSLPRQIRNSDMSHNVGGGFGARSLVDEPLAAAAHAIVGSLETRDSLSLSDIPRQLRYEGEVAIVLYIIAIIVLVYSSVWSNAVYAQSWFFVSICRISFVVQNWDVVPICCISALTQSWAFVSVCGFKYTDFRAAPSASYRSRDGEYLQSKHPSFVMNHADIL